MLPPMREPGSVAIVHDYFNQCGGAERVALELFSVVRKRKEILDRSGFLPQLDRIAGTKVI